MTLTELYGAGGSFIGPRVAERLRVPFLDRGIRPYFLFAGVPLMLLSVATFRVPSGLGEPAVLAYAYVTYRCCCSA